MKSGIINLNDISGWRRVDSTFYLSEGNRALRLVEAAIRNGAMAKQIGDPEVSTIWQPDRNILVYAGEGEASVPYLQPYDILEYLPSERASLSLHQDGIDELFIKAGTVLQTCSGRNLGPLVIADPFLERFAFGSDLIRINFKDPIIRYYIVAFLNTWIGQSLLHSNKTGSVIDHLSVRDLERICVPFFDQAHTNQVASVMKNAYMLYSSARSELYEYKAEFNKAVGVTTSEYKLRDGWGMRMSKISGGIRLDAAYYSPAVREAIELLELNGGIKLKTVARVHKPGGRYKINFVHKEYGIPIMSGRHLLQNQVVGLKYIPKGDTDVYNKMMLKEGSIAFPADGRVEGRFGTPVLINGERTGWYARVHVGRIEPLDEIEPGYIYLALSHPAVQIQISALACGSVVDSVYPDAVENIVIPSQIPFPYKKVVQAWEKFYESNRLKEKACELVLSRFPDYSN